MITAQAARAFIQACYADGLKLPTVRWYESKLRPFTSALGNMPITEVSIVELRGYVRALYERKERYTGVDKKQVLPGGLSIESIRGHIRALKRFFAWCLSEGILPGGDPMLKIRMPAAPRPVPKAITSANIRALLAACVCDGSRAGKRDAAIIAFLTDTGCRAGGLLGLTWATLMLDSRRAQVHEKFDRGRVVPMSAYTAGLLRAWLAVAPHGATTVFCALGTNTAAAPLTLSGLHQVLKRRAKQAQIVGRINPHSFRHAFGRRYLMAGGDASTLSHIMGHSSVAVTLEVYAAFLHEESLKRFDELGLMNKLLKGGDE